MWELIAKILLCGLGAVLLVAGVFLRPTEEARVQSRLADLWVRVDDLRQGSSSKTATFLLGFAEFLTKRIDRIFGTKLLEARMWVMANTLAAIGFWIAGTILMLIRGIPVPEWQYVAVAVLSLGVIAVLDTDVLTERLLKILAVVLLFSLILWAIDDYRLSVAILVLLACNVVSLRTLRTVLATCNANDSLAKLIAKLGAACAAPLAIVAAPAFLTTVKNGQPVGLLFFVVPIMLIMCVTVFAILAVLYRAQWFPLERVLHALERHNVFQHRWWLAGCGLAMMGVAFPLVDSLSKIVAPK